MKISILSFYQGLANRGVERYVDELTRRLHKKYAVKIYQSEKPILDKKVNPLLRRFYLDYYSRKIACFTLKTLKKLWRDTPNVLMPTNNGWQSIFCKIFCLFKDTKLVLAGHSGLGQDDKLNLWLFPNVFVAFSVTQKSWAKNFNSRVRIVKIPHGVDLEKFNPQVKPAQLDLERPIILCVSGPEKFKRVALTIRAVVGLEKGSLLVIGNQHEETIKLGERLLGKRFKQMTTSLEKMPGFYKAADLFTLVSDSHEAFGMVYLEAMACNLAVVATDDRLRQEIVGKAGIFVKNPEKIEEYKEILEKALAKNWQSKPRKQAEKFSWDKTAKSYQQLFESFQ